MTKDDKTALGVLALFAIGGLALTYLATGRREEDSPLIPNVIEDQIDKLVVWLDSKFTKRWVDKGLDRIQALLSLEMPSYASLLSVVHQAERSGHRGVNKRQFAMRKLGYSV